ncbi:hypothetical protein [Leptospirillum ferriphilum]|uniref:hypothetical protein n=1 Tax=Leptospirillum ferriphilum TaxID=178606 RepID=UPI0006B192DB|nr:hypothetical protein [Leptospirillum ferriphilum]
MNFSHWLPKFIWGEAITSQAGSDFEDCEYLTHTCFPRFVCRIVPFEGFIEKDDSIRVWREGPEGNPVWKTNFGFLARDFIWINWPDKDEMIAEVFREICVDRTLREELYEKLENL